MSNKLRGIMKNKKLKIIDIDGKVLDNLRPMALDDTLDLLQLKYGKKKRKII